MLNSKLLAIIVEILIVVEVHVTLDTLQLDIFLFVMIDSLGQLLFTF